jgi:hypothetical protein
VSFCQLDILPEKQIFFERGMVAMLEYQRSVL